MNRKPLLIGAGVILVIVVGVIAFFVIQSLTAPRTDLIQVSTQQEQITCPLETKMCPDGQIVIRDSTNDCEFYACPADTTNTSTSGSSTACTLDVKACPDGTEVGREASRNCQFKLCSDGTQLK